MCIATKRRRTMPSKTNTKASKATKATKSASKAVKKEAPAPAPAPAPVETAPVAQNVAEEVSPLQSANLRFTEILSQLTAQRKALTEAYNESIRQVREVQRQVVRDMKALEKRAGRRKPRKQGEHKPSGITKPTLLSDELAKFLNKPSGTTMARTQVTREINAYIRENKLKDPTDGKIINPDKRLKTLLRVGAGEQLTFFNLQKYMKHLFPASGASA